MSVFIKGNYLGLKSISGHPTNLGIIKVKWDKTPNFKRLGKNSD